MLNLFIVEDLGSDRFVAPTGASWGPRMFGGLVAAQSMAAACRTVVGDHHPHSMHAYFILPGDPKKSLQLDVERTRDGRSFSTRRVVASQNGAAIFEMSASFHRDEDSAQDWSAPVTIDAPDPESLPPLEPDANRPSQTFFDMRPVNRNRGPFTPPPYWVRANEEVPDNRSIQACVLAYLSDMGILAMARPPGGGMVGSATSLDHAIWFHRRFDPMQWHLFTGSPRSSRGGRGLAVGGLHDQAGNLIASIVQEGLFRPPRN